MNLIQPQAETPVITASPKYKLNKQDLYKVGIGFSIALGGAVLTQLQATLLTVDFGDYTVLIMAVNSVLVNVVKKLLSDEQGKLI
jgi:hypothetical protein